MAKPFNIVLVVRPSGDVFAEAFAEVVEYLRIQLRLAGHEVRVTRNRLDLAASNIIVRGHHLPEPNLRRVPPDSIVFNSEPLTDPHVWQHSSGTYRRLLETHHVWDYSPVNLSLLGHDRASFIPFLHCAEMARPLAQRTPADAFLFYGVMTPRRRRMIAELLARGVAVEPVFLFGAARDERILRARAVLNLHKTDDGRVFEPLRCFYPLLLGVPVISEATTDPAADAFRDAMLFVDDLADISRVPPKDPTAFRSTSATAAIDEAVAAYHRTSGAQG